MELTFRVHFGSGRNKFKHLDMYAGSRSLFGISQALLISMNAYFNYEFIHKATAAKGFQLAMGKSSVGSWEQVIHLMIQDPAIRDLIIDLGKDGLYDLLKWAFCGAVGIPFTLKNRRAKRVIQKLREQNDDLQDHLYEAAKRSHAAVKYQGLSITLFQGRKAIVNLDDTSLNFIEEEVVGNDSEFTALAVSRFNARTGTGRFVKSMEAQSIPFYPEDKLSPQQKQLMSSSLSDMTHGRYTPVTAQVKRITSRDGKLKKYMLVTVPLS